MERFLVDRDGACRLDIFLSEETVRTRSQIKQLIDKDCVLLNGKREKAGKSVRYGDEITVMYPEIVSDLLPENLPLDIMYEDSDVAVVNKAQGMMVHPGSGICTGTLVNALLYHIGALSQGGDAVRPGIVHRLDKNTSGIMIVAKNDAAHASLSRQFADRTVTKMYLAILEGVPEPEAGTIQNQIARDPRDRKRMTVVTRDGRLAITDYRVEERFAHNSLVSFNLKTGRTHQIRVHAKHMGHPVVGDDVYGFRKQRFALSGQMLHSASLTFTHPTLGKKMTFTAPLNADFENVLAVLRQEEEE